MYDLKSRVAFITGAGRGIGASIAEMIAEAGADIAIVDMDLETATKTAIKIIPTDIIARLFFRNLFKASFDNDSELTYSLFRKITKGKVLIQAQI